MRGGWERIGGQRSVGLEGSGSRSIEGAQRSRETRRREGGNGVADGGGKDYIADGGTCRRVFS